MLLGLAINCRCKFIINIALFNSRAAWPNCLQKVKVALKSIDTYLLIIVESLEEIHKLNYMLWTGIAYKQQELF